MVCVPSMQMHFPPFSVKKIIWRKAEMSKMWQRYCCRRTLLVCIHEHLEFVECFVISRYLFPIRRSYRYGWTENRARYDRSELRCGILSNSPVMRYSENISASRRLSQSYM